MSEIRQVFEVMASRFRPERSNESVSYYFSVGGEKWTVFVTPDSCDVQEGRQVSSADCVLKCDPDLFAKMVLKGKKPGPLDVARGRIKTNDVALLKKLTELFDMG